MFVKTRYIFIFFILFFSIVACNSLFPSERSNSNLIAKPGDYNPRSVLGSDRQDSKTLKVWWEKGYSSQEDEALQKIVSDWEKKTGKKIDLLLSGTDELLQKSLRASKAGNLPDIILSFKAERSISTRFAWDGKLADVSNVIEPVKNLYTQDILKSVYLYNNIEKKRSYYGVPIHIATNHIYYRKDLLKQVGLSEKDIPTDWNGFWQFWTKAQDLLRSKQKLDVYGLGLSLSVEAGDTFQTFEQILEAYNVPILDSRGQLQVDRPQVRQGIIEILDWYIKFYKQGYIPQASLRWLSPDNNRSLLNRDILMTVNHTLSIPGAVRQDLDTYRNKLGILEFPNKPNGEPMRHLVTVEQALVFADSKHQQLAKEFLSYMLQPKVMGEYLKSGGGRYAPVISSVWQDPFWSDPQDPHVSVATKTLTKGLTRTYYTFENPAYSKVLQENVWGVALTRIAVDNISSEQAADEAIARIKQIFSQWQS
jgi:multiple sugar transport system substrate-binding protein